MVTQLVKTNKPNITPQEVAILNQKYRVYTNLFEVTAEQIGMCTKVYDYQTRRYFWQVDSESDPEKAYNVRWSRAHGYTCTCDSDKHGFYNVSHPSRVCKHVRWAVAAQVELDQAFDLISQMVEKKALVSAKQETSALQKQVEEAKERGMPAWMMTGMPSTVRGTTVFPRGWTA